MDINMVTENGEMIVVLEGRLDTTTAPDLEKKVATALDCVSRLVLDFEKLSYISSAGLRVLLSLQKKMTARKGTMIVRNPNEVVMEVFEVTGFEDILTIERKKL
ncbi:MAG: STAS domain-containing protein [Eubacteriales bacterium]|nr:STAS domain-containing protein [Eubacteriales bacterium]